MQTLFCRLCRGCGRRDITRAIRQFSTGIIYSILSSCLYLLRQEAGLSLLFTEAEGEGAAQERELPQGTLQDLVRGMTIFINKTGIERAKQIELQSFVQSYKLAQQIHELHMQLEVAAHPDFQVLCLGIEFVMLTVFNRKRICAFPSRRKGQWL